MPGWYARPVLFVSDAVRALDFYAGKLGFNEDWRYAEEERLRIVQVSRSGCELILTEQWPEKAGGGLIFVSLAEPDLRSVVAEFKSAGVAVTDGRWGYDLKLVTDPDGNQLSFPLPS